LDTTIELEDDFTVYTNENNKIEILDLRIVDANYLQPIRGCSAIRMKRFILKNIENEENDLNKRVYLGHYSCFGSSALARLELDGNTKTSGMTSITSGSFEFHSDIK